MEDVASDYDINDEVLAENNEIENDITSYNPSSTVVYSRDWTIETINNQIEQGNIDLNPEFQRRNAWTDEKRSKLIESIIIGYPVPEIVLAEDPKKKRSFIVIDGKQRLLTIAGFISNNKYSYWKKDKLSNLIIRNDLNTKSFQDLKNDINLKEEFREFNNASLRCTIITNFQNNDVLYDIFYRLNSGSVPLATQELRQVLYRGEFSNFLVSITNSFQPIHKVLRLQGPDKRLIDIEVLLRLFSILLYPETYSGNLKKYLDNTMFTLNNNWINYEQKIHNTYENINKTIERLILIFGGVEKVGRKYDKYGFESRFNRVLFEVEIYFFFYLDEDKFDVAKTEHFLNSFMGLCLNAEFKSSIEATTKSSDNYKIRFNLFNRLMIDVFGMEYISPFI